MKNILLVFCFCICAFQGSANSFTGLWAGGGLAKTYNYGLNTSAGFTYYRGISYGIGVGVTAFYQKYNMYYDNENNNATGTSVRFNGAYTFLAPMFVFHLSRRGQTQAYVNAGAGFGMGTTDSVHRWSYESWSSANGKYDSMIDGAKTQNKMVVRFGLGLIHYYTLGGNWRLALSEDVGILAGPLGTYSQDGNEKLNSNMVNFFKPLVFSIRLGITYRTPTEGEGAGHRKKLSGR